MLICSRCKLYLTPEPVATPRAPDPWCYLEELGWGAQPSLSPTGSTPKQWKGLPRKQGLTAHSIPDQSQKDLLQLK
jgi:hypothetical protein